MHHEAIDGKVRRGLGYLVHEQVLIL